MKVILLKDVAKIGRRNEIVDVPDGYARNQLIPKRWADPATPGNIKKIEQMQAKNEATADAELANFEAIKEAIGDKALTIETEVNEQEHLFKAISVEDVVAAAKQLDVELPASYVTFATPIKEAGEHKVTLALGANAAPIKIVVSKK